MNKFPVIYLGSVLLTLKTAAQNQPNQKAYSFENLPVVKATEFKNDTLNILNFGTIKDGIKQGLFTQVAIAKSLSIK